MEISRRDARDFMDTAVEIINVLRRLNESFSERIDASLGLHEYTEKNEINVKNLREIAKALGIEYKTVPFDGTYFNSKTLVEYKGYTFFDYEVEECDAGED